MLPPTIDRLFTASLVLTGMWLAFSVSYSADTMFAFNVYFWASIFLVLGHHFLHYYLARRSKADSTEKHKATNDQNKQLYPEHLTSLFNIIFLGLIALTYVGMMWGPIYSGVWSLNRYDLNNDFKSWFEGGGRSTGLEFKPRSNYYVAEILQGLFGYMEAGVLLAIFGICIRERNASRKSKSGDTDSLKTLTV